MLATVLDFLDIDIPGPTQTASFLPLITGGGLYSPPIVSYSFADFAGVKLERDGFVYINEHFPDGADLLFDRKSDTREQADLAADRPDVVAKMREETQRILAGNDRFAKELEQYREAQPAIDERLYEKLVALGYLEQ